MSDRQKGKVGPAYNVLGATDVQHELSFIRHLPLLHARNKSIPRICETKHCISLAARLSMEENLSFLAESGLGSGRK